MLVKPVQPENAEPPILVTLLPIVTLVKTLQLENAQAPILVTLSGIEYSVFSIPAGYTINSDRFLSNKTPSIDV